MRDGIAGRRQTTRKKSFPDGIDAEVFRLSDLEHVAATVTDRAVREHVSLHFYEHPESYRIHHLPAPPRMAPPRLAAAPRRSR